MPRFDCNGAFHVVFAALPSALTICALAFGASSCTAPAEPEPTPLPPNTIVIGKCAFTERNTPDIESGEVFVYVLRDHASADLGVVTDIASTWDSLLDNVARQSAADILPARRLEHRVEFGGLTVDGVGDPDHFVGTGGALGEVFMSSGTTYGTDLVYPTCVFWE